MLGRLVIGGDSFAGFSSMADIADTGDDAPGTGIVLYQTTAVSGTVTKIDASSGESVYGSARVSLLGWPLGYVVSDGMFLPLAASPVSVVPQAMIPVAGDFHYTAAPAGLPVAFHVQPGPGEIAEYMPTNLTYEVYENTGSTGVSLMVLDRDILQGWAALISATLDPAKAQVGGSIRDVSGPVVGATISIPGATTWYFTDSTLTALTTSGGTRNIDSGPQFIMVNVTVPADEKAVGTLYLEGDPAGSGIAPLRAGELTVIDIQTGY